jgi:hypothetical protein
MKITTTPLTLTLGDKITLYLFLIFFLLWKEPDVLSSIINILNNFAIWIGK